MPGEQLTIDSDEAMQAFGRRLAQVSQGKGNIYLSGELGTGKTTLVRGLLRGLGHTGPVKSPTFALLEPYTFSGFNIYHFDLYRLSDPEELEYMGLRECFADSNLCLVEWPEQGVGVLPEADLVITLSHAGTSRVLTISAKTTYGQALLTKLDIKNETLED